MDDSESNILKPEKMSNSTDVSRNSNRRKKCINFNINFDLDFSELRTEQMSKIQ